MKAFPAEINLNLIDGSKAEHGLKDYDLSSLRDRYRILVGNSKASVLKLSKAIAEALKDALKLDIQSTASDKQIKVIF